MIRCNSITSTQQINGLLPTAEDWHAKLCFLEVCRTVYTHTLLSLAYLMILNYLDICYITIDKTNLCRSFGSICMLPNQPQIMEHYTNSEIFFIEGMWGRNLNKISMRTMIFSPCLSNVIFYQLAWRF